MRKNKKRIKINPIIIVAIIIIILAFGYSIARYVMQESSLHIQTSEKFYFNSSVLKENNPKYILKDWDGSSKYTLTIDLNNFVDSFRHTNEDITYEFSANCENENINITTSVDSSNLSLKGAQNTTNEIIVEITPENKIGQGEFIEVNVVAQSTKPYEQELSATFTIYVEEKINYTANLKESSNKEYVILNLETLENDVNLTIKYDNTKTILDTNNNLFESTNITQSENMNSISIHLEKNSFYNIIFIKKDLNNSIILEEDIVVE